jgi:hypothetical protein
MENPRRPSAQWADARRDAAVAAETLNSSSLEWRDEKELQEHPDVVNEKAETAKCGHYHSEP